ncbi:MAG: hypothetical protein HKN48_00240 [Flavobacteriaceae bacterium]|nr:hypothetical protein [Flavobacteriaceae bacterium]
MKKIALLLSLSIAFVSCNNDDDSTPDNVSVEFTFTHNWDGDEITNADFDQIQYTNANGEQQSISKLVYLISDITFTDANGNSFDAGDYNLVDVRANTNINFTPNIEIPPGDYTVSFTFGFDDEDNESGIYVDLNSADGGWNVPEALGGGYHYMRLEGMFIDAASNPVGYQYHAIRANDNTTTPITLQDTSFEVALGEVSVGSTTNVEVQMNVAEWFKNPNTWDLNVLNSVLMPNFDAQIMMSENGAAGVFDLGVVTTVE